MKNKILKTLALFLITAIIFAAMPLGVVTVNALTTRTSAPATTNKYYIHTSYGGLNECKLINSSTGECIPNCVGYAWGRAYEFLGTRPNLSKNNANTFYNYNKNGGYYSYGSTPKAGSIACWDDGSYGHVAFVESVSGDNVTFTESSYGGSRWEIKTKTTSQMQHYVGSLQGYIYLVNHTHNYTDYVYYWASHPHYKCYACSCGEVKENRSETAFEWSAWTQTKAPTCTEKGVETRTCSLCDETETREIAALGHSWNDGEITQSAGCTDAGVKKYTCTRCGATKTEAISATGHNPVTDPAVPATCTETGLTEGSHCANCNAIITAQQTIPALGHNNKIQSVNQCCDHVSVGYICDRCGQTSNETRENYILSEWSEDYPINVDESMIESKVQYAYSDKEITSSDRSELDGWIPNGKTRTGWSAKIGPVYSDPSNGERNVTSESYKVSENTKRVWHYSRGISGKSGWNNWAVSISPDCNLTYNQYITLEDHEKLTKKYDNWNDLGALYGSYIYDGFDCPYWFNEWSENVHVSYNYGTCWYYQEPIYTYNYYRWSEYSDWSDEEYTESETRQVKTRTVYRYKITPTGHNYAAVVTKPTCTTEGYTTHTCSICGDSYVDNYTNATGHVWKADPQTLKIVYDHNNEQHWRTCVFCHTIESTSHVFDDDQDTTCNVCGYVREVRPIDENSPQIVVESKKALAGKEFTVSVEVQNNSGFSYLEMTPVFSDALTLVSVENGDLVSDFTKGKQYLWVSDEDVTDDGTLLTFTFSISDTVEAGEYTVDFTVRSCVNYDEELVSIFVEPGTIEVMDYVYGDVNGDGVINGQDVVRLKKYLANYDYDTGTSPIEIFAGADANGDGVVNGQDVVRLKKYLANYDYETGTSPIVLGA